MSAFKEEIDCGNNTTLERTVVVNTQDFIIKKLISG